MRPTTTGPVLRPIRMRIAGTLAGLDLAAEIAHGALDPERGVDGAPRAVLMRDGRAEEGHHAVARVLVDRAFESVDLGGDGLEAPVHDLVNLLGTASAVPGHHRLSAVRRHPRLLHPVGRGQGLRGRAAGGVAHHRGQGDLRRTGHRVRQPQRSGGRRRLVLPRRDGRACSPRSGSCWPRWRSRRSWSAPGSSSGCCGRS